MSSHDGTTRSCDPVSAYGSGVAFVVQDFSHLDSCWRKLGRGGKEDKRMEEEMLRVTWPARHSLFERWKVGVDGYAAEVVDEGQVL